MLSRKQLKLKATRRWPSPRERGSRALLSIFPHRNGPIGCERPSQATSRNPHLNAAELAFTIMFEVCTDYHTFPISRMVCFLSLFRLTNRSSDERPTGIACGCTVPAPQY